MPQKGLDLADIHPVFQQLRTTEWRNIAVVIKTRTMEYIAANEKEEMYSDSPVVENGTARNQRERAVRESNELTDRTAQKRGGTKT